MNKIEFTLTLRSELSELPNLHRFIDHVCGEAAMLPELRSRLELALDEAVSNAIRHGHGEDPSKNVGIRISKDDDGWRCRVEDEGGGFDPASIPDPTDVDALLKPHGRGVFLIRALSDEARFEKGGRVLDLVFRPR